VAGELAEVRQLVTAVTWALMDAALWGGKHLEQKDSDGRAVAEGLLDRIGAVLARVTDIGAGGVR
jgi:hypothetical protein